MRKDFDEIDVKEVKRLTKGELERVGKNLKGLRVKNGLTLNDISFYTYSNISTVEKLEVSKLENVTLLTLMKLSVFYSIPLKDLFL